MREPDGHVLIVEEDRHYRIECPHRPRSHPSCATWEACGCDVPQVADDEDLPDSVYDPSPCPSHPGLNHRYDPEYVGEMTAPTGDCWPAAMAGDLEPSDLGFPEPGEYAIGWQCEDNYLDVVIGDAAVSS
jgi:hypothetical protein